MADDSSRDIGVLIGKFDALEKRLDRADESRRHTHERIDQMSGDVTGMKADVAGIKKDMDEMKPEVAVFRNMRGKMAGAVLVLTAIGAVIGAVVLPLVPTAIKALFWHGTG